MKIRNIFFLLIMIFGLKLQAADATSGVMLFPSFTVQREQGQLSGDQNGIPFAFRLGYLTSFGLYFGMLYSQVQNIGDYSYREASIGNSIGYFYSNASLIATYFLSSTVDESGGGRSYHRSEGSGIELDLAMMFPLVWGINIGPMLSYKSLTYNKQESSGAIQGGTFSESTMYPYIALQVTF
jgi:hypothetical protein